MTRIRGGRTVRGAILAGSLFCVVAIAAPAEARVTRIEITSVQSPTFDGASFGAAGQYEKLVGRVRGESIPRILSTA